MLANDRDPVVWVHYDVHGATDAWPGGEGEEEEKKTRK